MSLKKIIRKIRKPHPILFAPVVFLIRFVRLFMRTKINDPHNCLDTTTFPYITVTWHNRLLFFPTLFPASARKRTAAMISASRDGQYLANIIHYFGIKTVRGSSSRKATSALRESIRMLENKINVSITPDGPRGPRYQLSKGPIMLASKTSVPIVAIGVNYSSYWELKSWDLFRIPKPWARLELNIGKPIHIEKDLTPEQIEEYRLLVEKSLNEVSYVTEDDLKQDRRRKS